MKRMRRNIKGTLLFLITLFLLLISYFCYTLFFYGGRWFSNAYNPRVSMSSENPKIIPGSIWDRNNVLLASTQKEIFTDPQTDKISNYYYRSYHPEADHVDIGHVVGFYDSKYGKAGAEVFFIRYLLGYNNSLFEKIYQKAFMEQERGNDVVLTIDFRLHKYISQELRKYKGSVVMLNPQTGEILAMVSVPFFDSNHVSDTVNEDNLVNRATQGLYPPGSIFKVITAASALDHIEDIRNHTFNCTGSIVLNGTQISCYNGHAHGQLDIDKAFTVSCNGFFAQTGLELGWRNLLKTGEKFGFNHNFLFSDLPMQSSQLPLNGRLATGDLAWNAVGQGKILVTPLHMAMVAASIANKGVMMEPKLLYKVVGRNGKIQKKMNPKVFRRPLTDENAQIIQSMMEKVVISGTGKGASIEGISIAGKTGTAEVKGTKESINSPHAWFIGYTSDRPTLAIAVVLENGGSGGANAAPIARNIINKARELGY